MRVTDLEQFAGATEGKWSIWLHGDDWTIEAISKEAGFRVDICNAHFTQADGILAAAAPELLADLRDARDENARLREALEGIASCCEWPSRVARAALDGIKE